MIRTLAAIHPAPACKPAAREKAAAGVRLCGRHGQAKAVPHEMRQFAEERQAPARTGCDFTLSQALERAIAPVN